MLKQLTLNNFVLVKSLDIDFRGGLTTITGESGAGKSILLNALGLLLGERANTDTIRPGTDKADVSAEFDLSALPTLMSQLAEDELQGDEPAQCLIRRMISRQGRSRAFINNVPVTTQYLRQLGTELVDVHGQNEHLRLASHNTQLALLDDFVGQVKLRQQVAATYTTWQNTLRDIEQRQTRQTNAKDKQALLTYQLQELEELSLQPGEFKLLAEEQRRLAHAQENLETLHDAETALEHQDELRQSAAKLALIQDDHKSLASAKSNLTDALSLIEDAIHDLRHYREQIIVDPQLLAETDARLVSAVDLARKHKVDGSALPELTVELAASLAAIDAEDGALVSLLEEAEAAKVAYFELAQKLSKARKKQAPKFAKEVSKYMKELGIKSGAFDIAFTATESASGIDRVDYQVTTNPNFPPGALNQIASGGEQTRIALSIQIVAAQKSQMPCMILDEADVGVGGTTADTVGRILRTLGANSQVICITHAPQVAALGDHHLLVVKQGDHTDIQNLSVELRVDELARMLAGSGITEKTRDYAASLLDQAQA